VAVARDLLALDRSGEALAHAGEAQRLLSALLTGDSANADWRRGLASADNAVGAAQLAGRNYPAALASVRRGRDVLEPLSADAADRMAARHRAEGYLLEADVHAATAKPRATHDALTQALAAIEPAAEGSTRADVLWPRAQALIRLGRRAEAHPTLQALAAQEFRPLEYTRFCTQHACEGGTR
jgi:hypothetical protein